MTDKDYNRVLKLTRPHGDPVWINVGLIISFTREGGSRTQIETGLDRYVTVLETPEDICRLAGFHEVPTMWPVKRTFDDGTDDLVRSIVPQVD